MHKRVSRMRGKLPLKIHSLKDSLQLLVIILILAELSRF